MKYFKAVILVLVMLFLVSSAVFADKAVKVEKEKGMEKLEMLESLGINLEDLKGLEELKELHIDLSDLKAIESLKDLDVEIEGIDVLEDLDIKSIVEEALKSINQKKTVPIV